MKTTIKNMLLLTVTALLISCPLVGNADNSIISQNLNDGYHHLSTTLPNLFTEKSNDMSDIKKMPNVRCFTKDDQGNPTPVLYKVRINIMDNYLITSNTFDTSSYTGTMPYFYTLFIAVYPRKGTDSFVRCDMYTTHHK